MVDGYNPPPPPPPTGPPPRRTLKDLTSPSFDQQNLCINLDDSIELKSQLIHWLPKFKGLPGDDPNKHLQLFQHRLTSLKPTGTDKGRALLTAFPFSLTDSAKEWFYNLPQGSITSWNDMQKVFLENFPASKAATIRKAISGIEQIVGETLYDYWERYKKLLSSCPHHHISEQLIVQYFYDGMLQSERNIIDAASGGAFTNKTIDEATELIENMAANTQQFNTRGTSMARRVNEVSSSSHLEERMGNKKMMQQMAAVIIPAYEEEAEQVNVVFLNQRQRYDPYFNTYNLGWKDHSNFSYANKQAAVSNPVFRRQGGFQQSQFQPQHQQQNQSSSLEEMMKAMMQKQDATLQQNTQYQQKNDVTVKRLQLQMGQISIDVNLLKAQASTKSVMSEIRIFGF
ncbi:uncharacterized protein LOC113311916 [Papaver somniferum]|uniref:uncharacterized protein LOC113311916 n=1 Tax=Papaver somniferum TaxID=3469 RepID=UPI000E6F62CF|nr:uncharacterized protein LOC113311916 [Papaver somniferum]